MVFWHKPWPSHHRVGVDDGPVHVAQLDAKQKTLSKTVAPSVTHFKIYTIYKSSVGTMTYYDVLEDWKPS